MLKCYGELEIYTSGQVDTLNKTFKLSLQAVFCCGWQTIPNFNNADSKKYFLTSTSRLYS